MLWPQKKFEPPLLPNIRLEGFRVCVRTPHLDDWPGWAEMRGKNREFLEPLEPTWAENCLTRGFFIRRLQQQQKAWENGQAYAFVIVEKNEDMLIGGVNLNSVCRGAAQYASLGYWLDEGHQGQGYMVEALRLVINHAFGDLGLHRINASCLPKNERSHRLLLKLGFEEEGFAKAYLKIDGKWQDHKLFGLNKEKWTANL